MAIQSFQLDPNAGGGAVIKAGSIITDNGGSATVVFSTPMPNTNYVVELTAIDGSAAIIPMWNNKTTSGFGIKTENDKGATYGLANVDWAITPYSNT